MVTIGIFIFFGYKIGLQGMTAPFAKTLLYSGHLGLNMKHIFYGAVIIDISDAAMDTAMDVAAYPGIDGPLFSNFINRLFSTQQKMEC